MTTETQKFREYLAFYGADTQTWPEHARLFAQPLLQVPEYKSLLEAELRFEQLLGRGTLPQPSADFSARIIKAARLKNVTRSSAAKLFGIWENAPSAAIAAMLVLGCAVGIGALAPVSITTDAALTQSNSDDEGAML